MKLVVELERLNLEKRMKLNLELKLKLEKKKKKKKEKRKGLKFPFAEFISPRLKSHAADSADKGVSLSRFSSSSTSTFQLFLLACAALPACLPACLRSLCRCLVPSARTPPPARLREPMGGLQGALHIYPIAIT